MLAKSPHPPWLTGMLGASLKPIRILIGGDVCPTTANLEYFKRADVRELFNDLLSELENADLTVVNLECPLIEEHTPIAKNGPTLGAPSECINALRKAKVDILNLANNHIMDHGRKGLENTLKVCTQASIATVGAGRNIDQAKVILTKEVKGARIGVLAMAEHEFSTAREDYWGANPLNILDYVRDVKVQRKNIDYLLVLVHAGNQLYPLPSPRLTDTCHFLVEMGADAVIVQHSHCPGSYEYYLEAPIVYGQGDLIFEWKTKRNVFGFLVELNLEDIGRQSMNIIPYVQSDGHIGARKMSQEQEVMFIREIEYRSSKLSDRALLQREWIRFCETKIHSHYFNLLFGFAKIRGLTKLNRHLAFVERLCGKERLLWLQNVICCESHREILETIFEERRRSSVTNTDPLP